MTLMIENGTGRIVNMSSAGVHSGNPKEILYACSKAGVEAATRAFAVLGAKHRITVNAVAPHVIASGMAREKSAREDVIKRIPLGRPGKEEEVTNLVLFLSSQLSNYMTGTIVGIDGGRPLAR